MCGIFLSVYLLGSIYSCLSELILQRYRVISSTYFNGSDLNALVFLLHTSLTGLSNVINFAASLPLLDFYFCCVFFPIFFSVSLFEEFVRLDTRTLCNICISFSTKNIMMLSEPVITVSLCSQKHTQA